MRNKDDTGEASVEGHLLSRLLLIFGILLLLMAAGIAGYLIWQYANAQNHYHHIQSVAGFDISLPQVVDPDIQVEEILFDWDALRAINPDIVGWLIIPGTSINYPIVQGSDNDYYLYHLFDTTRSISGAIFADAAGSSTLDGQHNIIYGHNMFDGTMFSDIYRYINQNYFDEHRVLYLCTPEQYFKLNAIACIDITADTELRRFSFWGPYGLSAYIYEFLVYSRTTAPDLESAIAETESLYSFVTCESFDAKTRIVLFCIPVGSVIPGEWL